MKPYQIEAARASYPPGTPVELVYMDDDPNAVPPGTKGTVDLVDSIGTIHVTWENGRSLGVCPDVDRIRRVEAPTQQKDSLADKLKAAERQAAEAPKGHAAPPKDKAR